MQIGLKAVLYFRLFEIVATPRVQACLKLIPLRPEGKDVS